MIDLEILSCSIWFHSSLLYYWLWGIESLWWIQRFG